MSLRAWWERLSSPGYSWCERCKRPWSRVEPRTIWYEENRGCFALCTKCWDETDFVEHVGYFWDSFTRYWVGKKDWTQIFVALLDEWRKEVNSR